MSRTILLVDDDRRLRDLLKDYLNEKNLKVFNKTIRILKMLSL